MTAAAANVLGLFSGIFCLASTFMGTKRRMLLAQCADMSCSIASCLLLGGFSGAVVTGVALMRNIVCMGRRPPKAFTVFIMALTTATAMAVNTDGLYGLLPVAAAVGYAWVVMEKESAAWLLCGLIANNALWLVYKLLLANYAGAFMNLAVIGFSVFNVLKD